MANITFALDDQLIAAAKALAAREGTSVNALVRQALEHAVALGGSPESVGSQSGIIQALVAYSFGRRPRHAVMTELGITDYGQLIRLLNEAGLPRPVVPLARRQQMVAQMLQVLGVDPAQAPKHG